MKWQRGFTLTELIMVMVMAAVLAAFALPRFFNVADYQSRFVYDELLSAARYGHQSAVASGCFTRLVVTASSFSLLLDDNCEAGGAASFATKLVPHPAGDTEAFNQTGIAASAGLAATTVTFNPNGTASADVNIGAGGHVITVVAATGYVY